MPCVSEKVGVLHGTRTSLSPHSTPMQAGYPAIEAVGLWKFLLYSLRYTLLYRAMRLLINALFRVAV